MLLLVLGERIQEELRLVVMLLELLTAYALLDASNLLRELDVATMLGRNRRACLEAVWPVVDGSLVDIVVGLPVAVVIHDWADRAVDGQLLPVDPKARDLGVEVAANCQ